MAYSRSSSRFGTISPVKYTEKVSRETETSGREVRANLPQANVGIPVVSILGRKRVADANTIWLGNLRPLTQTTSTSEAVTENEITTITVVEKTEIIGYLADLHMGICLGPEVKLRGIYVDDNLIWSGDVGPARTSFTLNPNLTFLSDVQAVFSGGAFNQAPEPLIAEPDYPGYVGIATILLQGIRLDQPMGNVAFEVERYPNPLALATGDNVLNNDLSIASALVELMTNEWGLGTLSLSDIDVDAFKTAATVLADDENYCAIKIGQETSVAAILKALQEQGNLIVFQNPETGKITCQLIRPYEIDYTSQANRFNYSNVESIGNFQKTGWKDTINQVVATFPSRAENYKDKSILAQNPANLDLGRRTANLYYPYATNAALVRKLLARDAAQFAAPVLSMALTTNRDGATCFPGTVAFVNWNDYDLVNFPALVLSCRKQPLENNKVVLSVRQLVSPNNSPFFIAADEPALDIDFTAQAITDVKFIDAPYIIAAAWGKTALRNTYDYDLVYPIILPTPANNIQTRYYGDFSGTNTLATLVGGTDFPTIGQLVGLINKYDNFDTGIIPSVTIDNVVNDIHLRDYPAGSANVILGKNTVFINGEIFTFETVTDLGGGSWRLNNLYRALIDTVFEAHADNSIVYIVSQPLQVSAPIELPASQAYDLYSITLLQATLTQAKKTNVFTTGNYVESRNRLMSPPRPHNTKINGVRSSSPATLTIGASVTVDWKNRSRSLFPRAPQNVAASYAEVGQQQRVWHRQGGTLTALAAATAGSSSTFTMPSVGLGAGFLYVETTKPGYTSLFRDELPVNVV